MILAALMTGVVLAADAVPPPHDEAFWRKLAADKFEVPAGTSAGALLVEASALLGSPDPTLRDGVAYEAAAEWILKKKLLDPAAQKRLLALWTPNLKRGIGETGNDGLLLRSFSALELSLLAARDLQSPYLEPAELKALVDDALAYLAAERDLRGYDEKKGWMHATAHTADLLKFLARNPKVTSADAARILDGIGMKVQGAGIVFAWGEDERLASAVLAVLRRGDLDPAAWTAWLDGLAGASKGLWDAPAFDVRKFATEQNVKHLLARLYVLLYAVPEPSPKLVEARAQVMGALEKLP
ncbi:MAG TPA: DUF2785 domain-containing protein [Candidatus Polarisedimenticolaceae bacterium]|nr:DUF2785 domain-containing protein [Candidatus Polarisedimenticolaceae bacterium]